MTARPQVGDIVIHERRESEATYVLSAFEGEPQFTCATYAEAFVKAVGFAIHDHVDVWFITDGGTFRPVATHRV